LCINIIAVGRWVPDYRSVCVCYDSLVVLRYFPVRYGTAVLCLRDLPVCKGYFTVRYGTAVRYFTVLAWLEVGCDWAAVELAGAAISHTELPELSRACLRAGRATVLAAGLLLVPAQVKKKKLGKL
jgi:hypothetical protein